MEETYFALQKIGFSDKEAKIYLALLKTGESTVGQIADAACIKRPTAYLVLDELRKKGAVIKIPLVKKTIYSAKSPDDLFSVFRENLSLVERAIPKMRAVASRSKGVRTLYFEGLKGLEEALFYRHKELDGGTIIGFWAKDTGIDKDALNLFKKWGRQSVKRSITIRGITPDDESIHRLQAEYPDQYKDIILIPQEEYSSDVSIDVAKDFVRIVDAHDLKSVIIENNRVADAVKQIFAIVERRYESQRG